MREHGRVAGALGLLERRTCVGQRRTDVGRQQVGSGAKGQDRARASVVVGRLGKRRVAELDLGPRPSLCHERARENVRALDAGRHLLEQLSSIATACSPSPARRWRLAARKRRSRASAGSSGVSSAASSRELGCRPGRATGGRLLGGGVEVGRDHGVWALSRERQVAGVLLDVRDRARERPMDGAALPDRRLLIGQIEASNGCVKRTLRAVELDYAFTYGRLQRL